MSGAGDGGGRRWWARVPEPLWWAVLPALAGFVVGWPVVTTAADGTCTYRDWADLVLGPLVVGLVVLGVVLHLRRPPERRCATQLLLTLVVLLGGLGVYHVLTGLGALGGTVCG